MLEIKTGMGAYLKGRKGHEAPVYQCAILLSALLRSLMALKHSFLLF